MARATAELKQVVTYCDRLLAVAEVQDWPGAKNGLHLENGGTIHKIGAAVDAHEEVIRRAVTAGVDLLLTHHGLFWGETVPWTGIRLRKMKLMLESDLAVYSAHLPLDVHSTLGNNALLAKGIGLKKLKPFFFEKGRFLGFQSTGKWTRADILQRVEKAVGGKALLLPGGPEHVRRIGVVTGGAGNELALAAAEGVDTFITGEGSQHTYGLATELGINVIYGGHYATETFGVKALARTLAKHFGLPWVFIDVPTGL
jgi:dinuclear metal center YbgI/SA1388 family protein